MSREVNMVDITFQYILWQYLVQRDLDCTTAMSYVLGYYNHTMEQNIVCAHRFSGQLVDGSEVDCINVG